LQQVHEEISDLLSDTREDRFFCPVEARKKAMDFLARREYGQVELIKKLADKGYDRSAAEQAVSKLTEDGLQNDQRFAEAFVQSRINQGKGPVRIRLDLGQRGVGDGAIERALDENPTNWFELARNVRLRKFGAGIPPDFKSKAKQMRFLQYRGFEQDHVQAAFNSD
jgi:regulatory protein